MSNEINSASLWCGKGAMNRRSLLFCHLCRVPGSNLTIEVLHNTLVKPNSMQDDKPLPRTLHPQVDNCSRENKNRLVTVAQHRYNFLSHVPCLQSSGPPHRTLLVAQIFLRYLPILLECKVFDNIELYFGLKGHTHDGEDVATHDVHSTTLW